MRRRVTQLTKNGLNAQQQSLHDCKISEQLCESWQINCVFRLSLGLSTQIMKFQYKQAYKMIETGFLVWKSKNMKPYQPIFFGSNMLETKRLTQGISGFSEFKCQIMPRVFAESWRKSWEDRLYRLSWYIVEQNRLGSHLLIHWRINTFGFCRKPNFISILRLGCPNPDHFLLHYEVYRLNTLVDSVRYLVALLKYTLFNYIVEVYPVRLHG